MMADVVTRHKGEFDIINKRVYDVFGYRAELFIGSGDVYKRFTNEKKATAYYNSLKNQFSIKLTKTPSGKRYK